MRDARAAGAEALLPTSEVLNADSLFPSPLTAGIRNAVCHLPRLTEFQEFPLSKLRKEPLGLSKRV